MAEESKEQNIDRILGKKVGMTQIFDQAGNVVPVTVICAGPCVVTQQKTEEKDGYSAIQIGFGKTKKLNKPLAGHLKQLPARWLREVKVKNPADFSLGQEIKVSIFKAGEFVSVCGRSIGKGFAGTVKRHHHHRGPMSHGSKSHRITGSIGAGTTPGRVLKGREMSGRLGGGMATVKNLKVIEVKPEQNIILLKGAVPGKAGSLLLIRKG